MEAVDLGQPISVPVGPGTLGRVMNVLGEPIDEAGPVKLKSIGLFTARLLLDEVEPATTILETGSRSLTCWLPMPGVEKLGSLVVPV